MAHNFSKAMQILAHPASGRANSKRPATWKFTLTMSSNRAVKKDLLHFMGMLQKAT
jgi:hypothetical protein